MVMDRYDYLKLISDMINDGVHGKPVDAKGAVVHVIKDAVMSAGNEKVNKISDDLKEQAKKESGWNKFRDAVFLPLLLQSASYAVDKKLDKVLSDKIKK